MHLSKLAGTICCPRVQDSLFHADALSEAWAARNGLYCGQQLDVALNLGQRLELCGELFELLELRRLHKKQQYLNPRLDPGACIGAHKELQLGSHSGLVVMFQRGRPLHLAALVAAVKAFGLLVEPNAHGAYVPVPYVLERFVGRVEHHPLLGRAFCRANATHPPVAGSLEASGNNASRVILGAVTILIGVPSVFQDAAILRNPNSRNSSCLGNFCMLDLLSNGDLGMIVGGLRVPGPRLRAPG